MQSKYSEERTGVKRAEIDAGTVPVRTSDDAQPIAEPEREVHESRRANELPKRASTFFAAAELDPKTRFRSLAVAIEYIDDHRERLGKSAGCRRELWRVWGGKIHAQLDREGIRCAS